MRQSQNTSDLLKRIETERIRRLLDSPEGKRNSVPRSSVLRSLMFVLGAHVALFGLAFRFFRRSLRCFSRVSSFSTLPSGR